MKPRSQEAFDAVRGTHRRTVRVTARSFGGVVKTLQVLDGAVRFTTLDPDGTRSGSLETPESIDPRDGWWVEIALGIDGETWQMGEFPVLGSVRSSGLTSLRLGDWAYRRSQPHAIAAIPIGAVGQSVASVLSSYIRDTTPGGVMTVTRDDSGGGTIKTPVQTSLGTTVWSSMTALAGQRDVFPHVTSRATMELRDWRPPAGMTAEPLVVVEDSRTIDLGELVNEVIVQVESEDAAGFGAQGIVRVEAPSPLRWDGPLGRMTFSTTERVPVATQAAANDAAQRIAQRRLATVQRATIRGPLLPWLELADLVSIPGARMVVESLDFPLDSRGLMTVQLREQRL